MKQKTRCFVVSHTHWDREWYRTFQSFRFRLVSLIDELIAEMTDNSEYRFFHLDGQTIVLEDYIEIRPEMREPLEKLIREGRVIIGPWYVMPDEFLVSGESLVRNLQKGAKDSERWGTEPMKVGYVVDIFGHNSQFPQIMKGFGIESAVLYRGIGDYPRDLFNWVGVDGSVLLTAKLDNERSYSNFYFGIRWPFEGREQDGPELKERASALIAFSRERSVSENLLMLDGVDHMEMDPGLPETLNRLNGFLDDVTFEQTRLEDYIDAQRQHEEEAEPIHGELYHVGKRGVNNQLLKNVLSSMVHLKQMNDTCEISLTRWAEPYFAAASAAASAAAGPAVRFPESPQDMTGFLTTAWNTLMENHPHDSICGCSISRVHEDNVFRFSQVQDIADEIISASLTSIASRVGPPEHMDNRRRLYIFNAGQNEKKGIVTARLELQNTTQGNVRIYRCDGSEADSPEIPFQLLDVTMRAEHNEFRAKSLPEFSSSPECTVSLNATIPPVGYAVFEYEDLLTIPPGPGDYTYRDFHSPQRFSGTMRTSPSTWETDVFLVTLNPDGALGLTVKETGVYIPSLYHFEDSGDIGDGWNYRKPAQDRVILSIGSEIATSIESDGPYSLVIRQTHSLEIPASSAVDGRSDSTKATHVQTVILIHRDSPTIEFKTTVQNECTDHRLRVVFPTGSESSRYYTATPFWMQERQVARETTDDAVEADTGVVPSQGVTTISDDSMTYSIFARGLYEVEVSEDGSRSVALTLFRSFSNEVGMLTGEMGRMKRTMEFEYAVDIRPAGQGAPSAFISGQDWRCGMRSICSREGIADGIRLPDRASFLSLSGESIVLSSFRIKSHGEYIMRVYNTSGETRHGSATLPFHIHEIRSLMLDEETHADTLCAISGESTFTFSLGAAEVGTFAIRIVGSQHEWS